MKTVIEQNFEIENGFVIFKDRILLGPNNAWLPDVPQSRKNPSIRQPRFLRGSYLSTQQAIDEHYQTDMHVA
ncbi:MAG: hypothetical protein AAB574_00965 [Patescibacteria group bacterium]